VTIWFGCPKHVFPGHSFCAYPRAPGTRVRRSPPCQGAHTPTVGVWTALGRRRAPGVAIRNLDGLSDRLAMCDHALCTLHGFVSLLNCTGKTKFLLHPSVQFFLTARGSLTPRFRSLSLTTPVTTPVTLHLVWRIHCGVEVTESSTIKNHTLSRGAAHKDQRV
jgi:hypothetical protein